MDRRELERRAATWPIALALAAAWVAGAASCSPAAEDLAFQGSTMGTTYTVKVTDLPPQSGGKGFREGLSEAIEVALEGVNRRMSNYLPDSELSRLNRHEGKEAFPVSEQTLSVLRLAREVSEASGGAFDVTVGPLVKAWGFGPGAGPPEPPPEAALMELRPRVGYRLLELVPGGVRKADPRVEADLSAIAKGYAVDRVAEALEEAGVGSYMVEVGGEVRTAGTAPGGAPWRIGIEGPDPDRRTLFRVLPLSGQAVATSGDYRNFYEVDGRRYSHTIDPKTGRPVEHAGASVSVVRQDCASADAWATALLVLGPQEGFELAERENLAALFLVHEPGGGVSSRETPRFETQFGTSAGAETAR